MSPAVAIFVTSVQKADSRNRQSPVLDSFRMIQKLSRFFLLLAAVLFVAPLVFAKQYPVSKISVLLAFDCQTKKIFTYDPKNPEFEIVSSARSPSGFANAVLLTEPFGGQQQKFRYFLDSKGALVLYAFASSWSLGGPVIFVGHPDAAAVGTLCRELRPKQKSLVTMPVPIVLAPNIHVTEDVQWTGECLERVFSADYREYDRPFRESLTFSDVRSGHAITLHVNDLVNLATADNLKAAPQMCNSTKLP